MRLRLIHITLLAFTWVAIQGQDVTFRARTEARQIQVNSVFEVEFVLQNASGKDFVPPRFDGFEVVSGPNKSTSISMVNGRKSQSTGIGFMLLATKPGKFEIGEASIRAGKKNLQSNKLVVEVVAGSPGTADGKEFAEDVFIRAVIDTTVAYPGQQLRLDYLLYTSLNAHNFNILREDRYEEFHYRILQDFDRRVYTQVVDGVQYRVHTLKTVALYPRKPGVYHIQPFVARVSISATDSRRSFFLMTRSIPKTLSTDSIEIRILPLPEPQPESFSGAVGRYQMRVNIQSTNLSTDDAVVLEVDIQGDGDQRRWSPPSLDYLSDRFEVYDPSILIDKGEYMGGISIHRRVIEYLLLPRNAGKATFDLSFNYFNPDSGKYLDIRTNPVELDIKPGTLRESRKAILSDNSTHEELRALKSAGRLPRRSFMFIHSPLFYILSVIPAGFWFVAFWRRRKEEEYRSLDPATRKRLEARQKALGYLREAEALKAGARDREFYVSISAAIFSYLSGKLGIAGSDITKENVERRLKEAGITDELRENVMKVIRRCEFVLYAGQTGSQERQNTYDEALAVIMEMEEFLT